jgi:hypothetical protein
VETAASLPFTAWESFYVIIGSSAAALTGLQFVVVTLSAERNPPSTVSAATPAYASPTVVHFCMVLLVSAILSTPWPALAGAAVALGACGVGGLIYSAVVVARARRQTVYRPVMEDWIWHSVFPSIAYAMLLAAAPTLIRHPTRSLFAIASASLILLFTGIHNAWDSVVYIAYTRRDVPDVRD